MTSLLFRLKQQGSKHLEIAGRAGLTAVSDTAILEPWCTFDSECSRTNLLRIVRFAQEYNAETIH